MSIVMVIAADPRCPGGQVAVDGGRSPGRGGRPGSHVNPFVGRVSRSMALGSAKCGRQTTTEAVLHEAFVIERTGPGPCGRQNGAEHTV